MQAAVRWQALAVAAGLMVSLEAGAQEETEARATASGGGFGQTGQIVISSDASLDLGFSTNGDFGFIRLQPAADYFIRDNISLGVGATLDFAFGDVEAVTAGLNLRGGYNLPLGERLSLWPRLSMGFLVIDDFNLAGNLATGALGSDGFNFQLDAFAPALFHVTPHFFIGGGPRLGLSIGDDVDVAFALQSTVGGYF